MVSRIVVNLLATIQRSCPSSGRVQSSEFILAKRHGKPTRLVLHPTPTLALPRQDREEIEALVSQRHSAKRRRAFELADDLQAELRALGVETDDKAREWRIV